MALGGGGHRYAAGFTARSREVDEVVASVRDALNAPVADEAASARASNA
jgi:nanoRNase/pAp phosphatase (c-di-AMP/oligoRNAs hydrolase)